MSGTKVVTGPHISDKMAAVEHGYPHWHLFVASDGTICAVTCHTPWKGGGVTPYAPTPKLMRHEIAAEIHRWAVGA